jgi:hypothetical protein
VASGQQLSEGTRAGLLTAAAAAVSGVLIALSNAVGVAVVLGLLLLVGAARLDPKKLAVVGLIVVLLARTVEIATAFAPTTYIDEIATAYITVVLVVRRLLAGRSLRRPPGIWLFAAFALCGALSSVVSAVPLAIASAGGILVVKGVLLYFALAQVDWTRDDIPWLARTSAWVVAVALFCALINLVLPAQWTAVFANTGQAQYRSVLPSLIGPFTHPLQFGNFMSLAAIACATPLLYRARTQPRSSGATALFLASAVSAVLSFRRTAVVGMLAGLSYLALRRRHASLLVMALLVVPVAGVVLYPVFRDVAEATYQNFIVEGAENARTRMTVDSVTLAFQHFPFGVGFGRFGSAIARDFYSIEYFRLGYDAVNGLGSPGNLNNHGRWLTDTQWPAIVGEAGIVGAAFFVAGLWRIFATFRKASNAAFLPLRLLGLTGVGWSFHILLLSVAYPVFVTPPTSAMLFGLAGITYVILAGSLSEPAAVEEPRDDEHGPGGAAPRDLVRPGPAVRRRQALARGEVPDQDDGGAQQERDPR